LFSTSTWLILPLHIFSWSVYNSSNGIYHRIYNSLGEVDEAFTSSSWYLVFSRQPRDSPHLPILQKSGAPVRTVERRWKGNVGIWKCRTQSAYIKCSYVHQKLKNAKQATIQNLKSRTILGYTMIYFWSNFPQIVMFLLGDNLHSLIPNLTTSQIISVWGCSSSEISGYRIYFTIGP
jgi:hypothetical protein